MVDEKKSCDCGCVPQDEKKKEHCECGCIPLKVVQDKDDCGCGCTQIKEEATQNK